MTRTTEQYLALMMEEHGSTLRAINEGIDSIKETLVNMATKDDIKRLEQRHFVFEAVARDLSKTANDHETRITRLETAI